ncbi:hypothetical protein C2G38_2124709, partial [Gigaspora rosea]
MILLSMSCDLACPLLACLLGVCPLGHIHAPVPPILHVTNYSRHQIISNEDNAFNKTKTIIILHIRMCTLRQK